MPKLNDTQLILLSTASRHPDGSFWPLPNTLGDASDRATMAVAALIKSGLAEERETRESASVRRVDGDIRYGIFITEAGFKAIDEGAGGCCQPKANSSLHNGAWSLRAGA